MRVSEKVTINEIESWSPSDIVTIKAGTGVGKSYFIKNNLYAIARRDGKRILMLIHRKNCTDQFIMEIKAANKEDIIDIRTYQSIEAVERSGIIYELGHWDFIVCDEFHYFMSDASFNKYTDLSLEAILEQTKAIRIFMSATGDGMKQYLSGKNHRGLSTIDYEIPIDFSFIKNLEFFHKNVTFETYIERAINENRKAIFFIQSVEKAYELHKKYEEYSLFNCGRSHALYKHVDEEKINNMLKEERFNDLILFTSTVFDAGVNIVDDELNDIYIDVKDTGSLIQCLGRKRLQNKGDYINLHIKVVTTQWLGREYKENNMKKNMGTYFKEQGERRFVRKYYRENDDYHLVYDELIKDGIEKRLNELMYFKALSDIDETDKIREIGYIPYMKGVLGMKYHTVYEEIDKRSSLERYLDTIVGKKLFKEEQKELIEKIDLRVDGRQQKSYKKLNEGLEMIKLNYVILRKVDKKRKLEDGSDNPNRDKTYWELSITVR